MARSTVLPPNCKGGTSANNRYIPPLPGLNFFLVLPDSLPNSQIARLNTRTSSTQGFVIRTRADSPSRTEKHGSPAGC